VLDFFREFSRKWPVASLFILEIFKADFEVKLGLRPLINSGFQAEAMKQ
jgi:hypothetical protein